MPGPEDDNPLIEYDRLNVLGKAVYLAGAAADGAASLIDKALERAVDLVLETERAFKEGRDAPIEDAKVLREWTDDEE